MTRSRVRDRLDEVIERSLLGPSLGEEAFNRLVVGEMRRVVREHEIRLPKGVLLAHEDGLVDRVWEAALEFLASCGVYCQTTGRVIRFSREEIESRLQEAPAEVRMGEGADARVERFRAAEDPRPPLNMGSSIGSPVSEELFVPVMVSYIQEPLVDVTCAPSLTTVDGREIRSGSPLEILAAWEEAEGMREALARAGRPGMAWTGMMLSMTQAGQLSAANPLGLRATDLHTFGVVSELKTNYDILNKLTHSLQVGGIVDPYANPIYGGLAGGTEGTAVLIAAAMLALSVVFLATCVGTSPTHPFRFNDTGPELLAASSLAFQALARHTHLMTNLTVSPVGGPGTTTLLYECIAFSVMSTVSGASRILGPRSATGSVTDHFSGLEARFNGEVMRAAAGLGRSKGEEIVRRALSKYEAGLDRKPYGLGFPEVYSLKTLQPTSEWLKMYETVKQEAAGWGLTFVEQAAAAVPHSSSLAAAAVPPCVLGRRLRGGRH